MMRVTFFDVRCFLRPFPFAKAENCQQAVEETFETEDSADQEQQQYTGEYADDNACNGSAAEPIVGG